MPLIKYFGFVGSALALLLISISWCFPERAMVPGNSDAERPVIRISSAERAPERVTIDTSLPTLVPPSNIGPSTSIASVQSAQPLRSAFAELDVSPKTGAPKSNGGVPKPKLTAKHEPAKNVSNHRAAKPLNIVPAPPTAVQGVALDTRMSLLETLKERLGQTFFRLN
ncbi:hypothetical protein [Bradyrhizobium canariense]|uniref:hypothetical protein n=1 Tax=Bradyrhizobium canariense TaxID=255045 RepID=UPI0011782F9D|nr:hypothetical protein [Bradyrhizobium canariense]